MDDMPSNDMLELIRLDPLFKVMRPVNAKRWVDQVFEKATVRQILAMAKAFRGYSTVVPSSYKVNPSTAKGGSGMDPRVYKLLEMRDSLHDFPRYAKKIAEAVGVEELPWVKRDGEWARMTLDSVASFKTFTDDITSNAELYYGSQPGSDSVTSPLYGMDWRPLCFKHPAFTGIENYALTLQDQYPRHTRRAAYYDTVPGAPAGALFETCEVHALPAPETLDIDDPQVIEMTQICAACGVLCNRFSDTACFVLDANELVGRLFTAYDLVADALAAKFRVIWIEYESVRAAEGRPIDPANPIDELIEVLSQVVPPDWTTVKCDASLLDGGGDSHFGKLVNSSPTGPVFGDDSVVRVTFGGCSGQDKFEYIAASSLSDDRRGTEEYNVNKTVQSGMWRGLQERYSKRATTAILEVQNEPLGRIARYTALKRAGDWGQIEHCKKYGMVFVTTDKPAFHHAVMRDTCAWLIEIDNAYKSAGYVLWTFVVYTSHDARHGLCTKDDIVPPSQAGGSRANNALAGIAVATIAASMFIS